MVHEAVTKALKDSNLTINYINQATVGYVYGMMTSAVVEFLFESYHRLVFF